MVKIGPGRLRVPPGAAVMLVSLSFAWIHALDKVCLPACGSGELCVGATVVTTLSDIMHKVEWGGFWAT